MSENLLVQQFISHDPQSLRTYEIYRQAADIYYRTKAAAGDMPKAKVLISNSKSVKVDNVTTWSSKVLTCK